MHQPAPRFRAAPPRSHRAAASVPRQFTIGWIRESEIKHGRIAMFGFIGYIVHENGIRSPDGIANLVSTDLSAPAVWDATPEIGKWQIILFVGLMDIWRESKVPLAGDGQTHCTARLSKRKRPLRCLA